MLICLTCPQSPNPITLRTLATHNSNSSSVSRVSSLCCTRCNNTRITCSSLCNKLCTSPCNSRCSNRCSSLCSRQFNSRCNSQFSSRYSSPCNNQCNNQCSNNQCTVSRLHTRRTSYHISNRRLTLLLWALGFFPFFFLGISLSRSLRLFGPTSTGRPFFLCTYTLSETHRYPSLP